MVFFIQNEVIIPWDLSNPKIEKLADRIEFPLKNRLRLFSAEMVKISKYGSGPEWFEKLNQISWAFSLAQIELGTFYMQYYQIQSDKLEVFRVTVNKIQKQKYLELGRRLCDAIQQHCPDKQNEINIPSILL